jgi:hypothetical protein
MAARFELNGAEAINCNPCHDNERGNGAREAAILAERYECLVKILFGLESRSKLKSFTEIDSLAHSDAMPNPRFHLGGDHIRIVALEL